MNAGRGEHTIEQRPAVLEPIATDDLGQDVQAWLARQARAHNLCWLLAHCEDGVVWGRMAGDRLITVHDVARDGPAADAARRFPALRLQTLQQARVFGEPGELLLWRDGDNAWHARLLRAPRAGERATFVEAIDEVQVLLGTSAAALPDDFTLMEDGVQGLEYAVPLPVRGVFSETSRPLRLRVRQYLREDDPQMPGAARVAASRLVDLYAETKGVRS